MRPQTVREGSDVRHARPAATALALRVTSEAVASITASPQRQRRARRSRPCPAAALCDFEAVRRAKLRASPRPCRPQAAPARGRDARADRRARQRDIGEFFVLERHLGALDLLVRARARQALGEVAPVGRGKRTWAVMRAGRCDMRAGAISCCAQRDDPRVARRRAGLDDQQRVAGLLPTSAPASAVRSVSLDLADHIARHHEIGRLPPWRAAARARRARSRCRAGAHCRRRDRAPACAARRWRRAA